MWMKHHIIPLKCLTDNGRQFKSLNFNNLMRKYKIEHIFTSPHNPTGNSIIERVNREISIALRLSRGRNLKNAGINICKRINLNNNSTIGYSPFELFFRKPITDAATNNININDNEIINKMKRRQESRSNQKIKNPVTFKANDLIYLKTFNPDKITRKFE
ncbi:Gag-Pro-Pol polyprotein [Dictyocoela muelleri]|nr:Gag-Pro-Pol polyprotein [Dictyocoela muelleri]